MICTMCGEHPAAESNADDYCVDCEQRFELRSQGERIGVSRALAHAVDLAMDTHSGSEIREIVEACLEGGHRAILDEGYPLGDAEALAVTERDLPTYLRRLERRASERVMTSTEEKS
ncbi:MAG: hypothetical protein JWQ48_196 [Conexibacter sp.]|nr:hypothetical protein [Conexibacter sp.]